MKKINENKIYLLLAIVVTGVFIVAMAFAAALYLKERSLLRAEANLKNLNIALVAQTEAVFKSTTMLMRQTAEWLVKNPHASSQEINAEIWDKKDVVPFLSGIAVVDEQGILRASITQNQNTPPLDLSFREWFKYHQENPQSQIFIGTPFKSIIHPDNPWLIPVSFPVRDKEGKLLWVISAPLYPDFFKDFFAELALGTGAAITMQRDDSTVLARIPFDEKMLGRTFPNGPITTALKGRKNAVISAVSAIDGIGRIISGYRLNNFPLYVVVALSEEIALANWKIQASFIGIAALVLLIMLAIVALLVLRLQKETMLLHDAQKKLLTSQQIARLGTWEYDLVNGKVDWSEETRRIFGYSEKQDIDIDAYFKAVHPEDLHLTQTVMEKMQHGMKDFELEYRIIAKDGQLRHVHEKGIGIFNQNGKLIRLSGTILDITERKEAQLTVIRHQAVLSIQDRMRSRFIENKDLRRIFSDVLNDILMITESEYGYIGELLYENGTPYLKLYTMTDISWDEKSRNLYEIHKENGFELRNQKSLFGSVITTGRAVISNDPANDPRAGGVPPGHPSLNAFLGIPIYYGAEMLGQVGIANRQGGYSLKVINEIMPVISACGQIIAARNDYIAKINAEETLVRQSGELEKTNADLESFAHVASHDLREPLRMVGNYIGLIERRYKDKLDDDGQEFIKLAKEGAIRLDRMIVELLEYSRIGRGDRKPSYLDTRVIIEIALQKFLSELHENDIVVNIDEAMPIIYGSKDEIASLFQHIISNSIKYKKDNVRTIININAKRDRSMWHFIISDNGIGINQDHDFNQRIFKIFQRLHGKYAYGGGTGIGLAICRKIVERHGGNIWVESKGENQGAAFHFTIPV